MTTKTKLPFLRTLCLVALALAGPVLAGAWLFRRGMPSPLLWGGFYLWTALLPLVLNRLSGRLRNARISAWDDSPFQPLKQEVLALTVLLAGGAAGVLSPFPAGRVLPLALAALTVLLLVRRLLSRTDKLWHTYFCVGISHAAAGLAGCSATGRAEDLAGAVSACLLAGVVGLVGAGFTSHRKKRADQLVGPYKMSPLLLK